MKKMEPHILVWGKSIRSDGTFSRPDFRFDTHSNTYECPGGRELTSTGRPQECGHGFLQSSKPGLRQLRAKAAVLHAAHRKIARSIHEEARDVARQEQPDAVNGLLS
ncbi:hypothetical protein [Ramlibacter sp. AN1133]|uniref:hypothetical protein n=1 Tax=Ramlibacter sp. AN1133 TaxID=3133429 RepID=UPI0030C473CE